MAIEGTRVRWEYSKTRMDRVEVSRLYPDDGLLVLDTDPDEWIVSANPADCPSVLTLELNRLRVKKIDSVSKLNNLRRLLISTCFELEELPENLGELSNLSLLDIRDSNIKWLPRSIANLSKLSQLLLPREFRLTTLMPTQLNDSLLISVDYDVRKTWGELKTEIAQFGTYVRYMYSKTTKQNVQVWRLYSDDGFLLLDRDPDEWIMTNPADCLSVLSLELAQSFPICSACWFVKNIDCVTKLPNLQRLLVRDCFKLEELPANLGDLGSLTHLSIEWCRSIKWLPSSIGKLSNLTALKIYHCQSLEELPANLGDLGSLTYLCLEKCDNIKSLPNSIGKLFNLTDLRIQSCKSLKELPADLGELSNLSLLDIEYSEIKWLPCSIANLSKLSHLLLPREFRLTTLMPTQLNDSLVISVFGETWGELKTEIAQFGSSHLSGRTDQIDNLVSSSLNHELHAENEDCVVPVNFNVTYGYHIPNSISQVDADANGLEVSENNPHVQPVMFPSSAANPNSSLQETTLDESNVQTFQNIQMDNMENEQRTASAASENPVHDRSDDRALQHKRKKTEKLILTKETLEELMTQGITIEEAAKKLGVSRPTVVRSLREKGMSWPRPKKLKQHEDTNMVDPANAMRRTVEEPSLETQCQVDGQQMEEHSNGANECTSSNTDAQTDESPSTFVVIATLKNDSVKFDFSLRSSIEQLKAEVGKRLELKVGKFKMKYVDVAGNLLLMADVSDLKGAFDIALFSKEYGKRVVKLTITK